MRILSFVLSVLLATQIVFLPTECQAFPIYFSPNIAGNGGQLTAKMPLEKLGSINIPQGRFKIKGNWAEVSTVEEFQFDHHAVLSGPVINVRHILDRNKFEITGLAYFCKGDWLAYLSTVVFRETISTDTYEFIGQIISVDDDTVMFRNTSGLYQKIPIATIRDIDSPHSFRFRLTGDLAEEVQRGVAYEADANNVNLVQANRQFHLTALSRAVQNQQGDGDLSKGKLIAIGTLINTIEIGQMTPFLVLGLLYPHLRTNGLRAEAPFQATAAHSP